MNFKDSNRVQKGAKSDQDPKSESGAIRRLAKPPPEAHVSDETRASQRRQTSYLHARRREEDRSEKVPRQYDRIPKRDALCMRTCLCAH